MTNALEGRLDALWVFGHDLTKVIDEKRLRELSQKLMLFGFTVLGLFHPIAAAVKIFTKEDLVPEGADRVLHTIAPFISVFFALAAFAGIRFGDQVT